MKLENLTPADIQAAASQVLALTGPTLLAYACDEPNRSKSQQWAEGSLLPNEDQLERLMVLAAVLNQVRQSESDDIARAWLIGQSCGPDADTAPASAIRACNFEEAQDSARRLCQGVWS